MSKSFKTAGLAAVVAIFLAMPLMAQDVPELESNTGKATAGVFTNDIDDSMDVHGYADVEFENWQGFLGYNVDVDGVTLPLSLGYARRFGDIYLGAWYTGNILSAENSRTITKSQGYEGLLPDGTEETATEYLTDEVKSANSIQVLLGIIGMGFKLGFYENFTTAKTPIGEKVTEEVDGSIKTVSRERSEYKRSEGLLYPYLEWGMGLKLGEKELAIRPKAFVGFAIYTKNDIDNQNGSWDGTDFQHEYIVSSDGTIINEAYQNEGEHGISLIPYFRVGADVDIASTETSTTTVGLSYGFGFLAQSGKYDAPGYSGKVKGGSVSWTGVSYTSETPAATTTHKDATLDIEENSGFIHNISPGFYFDKEIVEGLKIGLSVELPLGITTRTSTAYRLTYHEEERTPKFPNFDNNGYKTVVEGRSGYDGTDEVPEMKTETSTFTIAPGLALGVTYALVPERFTINAGAYILPFTYTNTVTRETPTGIKSTSKSTTTNSDGIVTAESVEVEEGWGSNSVTIENLWGYAAGGVTAGFTFFFGNTAALDLAANFGANSDRVNIADLGVMLLLKF